MRFGPLACVIGRFSVLMLLLFLIFPLATSLPVHPAPRDIGTFTEVNTRYGYTEVQPTETIVSRRWAIATCGIVGASFSTRKSKAATNRRQIELCLVAIQRVSYWAERQANALAEKTNEQRRSLYLESRLGAKAILTSRVGPGSTGTIYTLATLRVPECLADMEWHAAATKNPSTNRKVTEAKERLTEALASIVEFDGLETLTDPSPRSTLTIAQYTEAKADYVVRALRELVLPSCQQLLAAFGPEPLERSRRYIDLYFSSEIPP